MEHGDLGRYRGNVVLALDSVTPAVRAAACRALHEAGTSLFGMPRARWPVTSLAK
jgi:hypothetical protein